MRTLRGLDVRATSRGDLRLPVRQVPRALRVLRVSDDRRDLHGSHLLEMGESSMKLTGLHDTAAANSGDQTSPISKDPISSAILYDARDRALAAIE